MTTNAQTVSDLGTHSEVSHQPALRIYTPKDIKFTKQIADLTRYFLHKWNGRLPDTAAAHRDCDLGLDLCALYDVAPALMDRFFERTTDFGALTRERLKRQALARGCEGYTPEQLGQLIDLDANTRRRLGITNITAVNPIGADELKREDAEYRRNRRAAEKVEQEFTGKPISGAQRLRADRTKRQLTAVRDIVKFGEGKTVATICKSLSRLKHCPFGHPPPETLRKQVRRLVGKCHDAFVTELRVPSGRPDQRPQMWVYRRPVSVAEYERYLRGRLAEFTPIDAAGLARWFNAEEKLRESCGIIVHHAYTEMARVRLNELRCSVSRGVSA
jgi:hypothetical protein